MGSKGKMTILVGGQYGSEGKGAIVAAIANDYGVHVRVGSPNAGHTIYWEGEKHVMQSIPCGWINPNAKIVIGRGALINMKLLMNELVHILQYYPDFLDRFFIDPEAGILDEKFHLQEGGTEGEMHRRIGSTGEGVGPARVARVNRDPAQFRQFKDVAAEYNLEKCICDQTPWMLKTWQESGLNVLVEGTQGSGLSLLHSNWPYCTSIDTNASGIASEVGIAPSRITDVILVCRTFPIRVHGNSGPMKDEISWDELNKYIVKNGGVAITPEKTTVTKKVRRIAEWDRDLLQKSITQNEPTEYAITFADYIDPSLYGVTDADKVSRSELLWKFISKSDIPVDRIRYIGTGPDSVVRIGEGKWQ